MQVIPIIVTFTPSIVYCIYCIGSSNTRLHNMLGCFLIKAPWKTYLEDQREKSLRNPWPWLLFDPLSTFPENPEKLFFCLSSWIFISMFEDKLRAVWSKLYRVEERIVRNPSNFSPSIVLSLSGQSFLKVTMPAECRFENSSMSSYMEGSQLWVPSQVPGSSRLFRFVTKLSGGDVKFFRTLKRSGVSLVGWSLTHVVRGEKWYVN